MRRIGFLFLLLTSITFRVSLAQNVGQIGDTLRNYTDINGMKQGYWRIDYPNGNPRYIGYFKNDKPIGKFTRYYSNGKIQSEAFFYDESRYSSVKFYNQAQRIIATGRYHEKLKDSVWTFYNDEGKLLKVETYRDGKLDGESRLYFLHSNDIYEITYYKDNVKHGEYRQYYTEGILRTRARYCYGQRCDTTFIYHENGKIEYIIPYQNDVRHGIEQHFDEKGNLIESIPYDNGRCTDPTVELKRSKEMEKIQQMKGKYPDVNQFDDPLDFLRKPLPVNR